jgi:hypothetical protein
MDAGTLPQGPLSRTKPKDDGRLVPIGELLTMKLTKTTIPAATRSPLLQTVPSFLNHPAVTPIGHLAKYDIPTPQGQSSTSTFTTARPNLDWLAALSLDMHRDICRSAAGLFHQHSLHRQIYHANMVISCYAKVMPLRSIQ